MKVMTFLFVILFIPAFASAQTPTPAPCTPVTVWYCDYWQASCGTAPMVADPAFTHTVTTLPLTYSKTDPAGASTCTGTNGTVTCPAATTSVSVTALPVTNANCTFSPANRLPASVSCSYNRVQCNRVCTQPRSVVQCQ